MRRLLVLLVTLLLALPAPARVRSFRGDTPTDLAPWLRQRAIPTNDLRPLLGLIGDARVVALGDATHGTHEFFEVKQRLIPLLVAHGFRTIAFEAPYGEWQAVDDYVRTGIGNPADLIASEDYFFWDSDEVLDTILWARAQNAAGLTPRIKVVAVDVAHPVQSAERVVSFLRRVDPPAADDAAQRYDCLNTFTVNPGGVTACRAATTEVKTKLAESRYADAEYDEALHAARVVEQGAETLATNLANRDSAMAENIAWLAERGKVIVWGHNEHFGETDYALVNPTPRIRSSGQDLAALLGDAYFVLGSLAYDGTFHAYDTDAQTNLSVVRTQRMTPPTSDDYATLLRAAGAPPSAIIPLRGTLPEMLDAPHRIRIAGSGVVSRERATLDLVEDLARKFDAVLYVELSTPTHLRRFPIRR